METFPANLPDPGVEPASPALQADSLPNELSGNGIERKCEEKKIEEKETTHKAGAGQAMGLS